MQRLLFFDLCAPSCTDPVHMMKSSGCVSGAMWANADWMRLYGESHKKSPNRPAWVTGTPLEEKQTLVGSVDMR